MKSVKSKSVACRVDDLVAEPGCSAGIEGVVSFRGVAGSTEVSGTSGGDARTLPPRTSFFLPFLPFTASAGAALRFATRFDARIGGASVVARAGAAVHVAPSAVTSTTSTVEDPTAVGASAGAGVAEGVAVGGPASVVAASLVLSGPWSVMVACSVVGIEYPP
jgi:hypothetical protein